MAQAVGAGEAAGGAVPTLAFPRAMRTEDRIDVGAHAHRAAGAGGGDGQDAGAGSHVEDAVETGALEEDVIGQGGMPTVVP